MDVVQTDYHAVFSPTWQVPVLYFSPRWATTMEALTLQEVYTFLVETSSKGAIEDVGIMGGISHGVLYKLTLPC
jgi:ubiquitin-like-conjugating enzyme ATG10